MPLPDLFGGNPGLAGRYALSVRQPWASLLAIGAKRFETRSWHTHHRGPLLIHAAKAFPLWTRQMCHEQPFRDVLAAAGLDAKTLPRGAIIARATLANIWNASAVHLGMAPDTGTEHEFAFGNWAYGRWAWQLVDVEPLPEPIPAIGTQGLWTFQPAG